MILLDIENIGKEAKISKSLGREISLSP